MRISSGHDQHKRFFDTIIVSLFFFLALSFVFYERAVAQATSNDVVSRRAQLEKDLVNLEKEIEDQQQILTAKQREGVSLERDIAILNAEISKAKLSIKARVITIKNLEDDIGEKKHTISKLSDKIDREIASLVQLLRKTDEIESSSLVEVILTNTSVSEFFVDVDAFESIKSSLNDSINSVKTDKAETEKEKKDMEDKKAAELDARMAKEAEKRAVERNEAEKKSLLTITKNQEKAYKKVLAERKVLAAKIRSTLFSLRDSAPIPFGDALDFATAASKSTGVRPAFILAILTQETNLGENIGACYLKDSATGAGVGKNTGTPFKDVMKSPRDTVPFLALMERLGLDPFSTPVSCPQGGGYGGAMGPSQFISSTWTSFESRIKNITGSNPPNPWSPKDAITATTIYLDELGAGDGGYTAERRAALKYYAGGNWSNPKNAFYADGNSYSPGVMKTAQTIQETMIDPLKNY